MDGTQKHSMKSAGIQRLLGGLVPPFIFESIQHATLCAEAAIRVVGDHSTVTKVLANLYKRHATDLQAATACDYLATQRLPVPKEVADLPLTALAADRLKQAGVTFAGDPTLRHAWRRLATPRHVAKTVLKVLANWMFAALGTMLAQVDSARVGPGGTVIRAWVDVTEELYPDEFPSSLVIVYPFDINLSRQWRFLASLRARRLRYTLAGYPYSPLLLLRWLLTLDDRARARLEVDAAVKHAHAIVRQFRPVRMLTTDEFEPASFAMHETLIAAGVEVENKAHGVGKYSPFVAYSRFGVLNDAQADYYAHFNPGLAISIAPRPAMTWPLSGVRTLVLVDQLVTRDGSLLDGFQARILEALKRVGAPLGYGVALKLHPNSKESPAIDGVVCERGLPWPPGEALFLTAFSTAYLSFECLGPTWLVEDASINPRLVFGKQARIIEIQHLGEFIRGLGNFHERHEEAVHGVLHATPGR
jgi:hypothetical protein